MTGIDSEDLPLNIYRANLQQKNMVKKCLEMTAGKAARREEYEEHTEQGGKYIEREDATVLALLPRAVGARDVKPEWLNMVKGVVDSEILPLIILSTILQSNFQSGESFEQNGKCIKLGTRGGYTYRTKITEHLRFLFSKPGTVQGHSKQ